MRRASQSSKLALLLSQSDEFNSLAKTIKHQNGYGFTVDTVRGGGSIDTVDGGNGYQQYQTEPSQGYPSASGRAKKQQQRMTTQNTNEKDWRHSATVT